MIDFYIHYIIDVSCLYWFIDLNTYISSYLSLYMNTYH